MVIGASSGIGEAIALQLGSAGADVAIIARRAEELERVKGAIEAAGGKAHAYVHDVREYRLAPALFQQIAHDLGGLDLVVYAAGVMPLIEPNEYSFEKDEQTVDVNCLGAVAWLNEAAERFEHTGQGSIVGISSVAADRGRKGFPVYGASKAFFDTYLEALRNRVGRLGVVVTTVKPGPVDTPMSRGVKKRPLLISADAAATAALNAVAKRKSVAYVPGTWRPIMFVIRHIPSFIFRKLNF
jgi:decaprenylphospho-beta-D-erythro-pentofuranosid-2-ulose 2-reductase